MQIKCVKSMRALFIIYTLFLTPGCQFSVSVAEGEEWFTKNQFDLMKLHKQLLQSPAIKRVEPDLRLSLTAKYRDFTEKEIRIYDEIKRDCIELGLVNISVSREEGSASGELISINYTLKTYGLSVSGKSMSIEYMPTNDSDNSLLDALKKRGVVIKKLQTPDWYVVVYS